MFKIFMIITASVSLGLAIIGIFLPLLPTTPFLLLSAYLFSKSSDKLYNWLLNNKIFGKYIRNYRERRAIPLKVKITSISVLWVTILFSVFFIVKIVFIKIILLLIALLVTIHILRLKTLRVNG